MKNVILFLLINLMLFSCNSNNNEMQNVNPNDIQISEIIHDSLTSDQINKIKKIQSTFEEVLPISLAETITNFKRDQNPDSEINIWLQMANTYEKYLISRKNTLDIETKKEVFNLILSRSMMSEEEAIINSKLTILSEKEAKEVLSFYTLTPDSIDIYKKP